MNKKFFLYSLMLFPCITKASQELTTTQKITIADVTLYDKTNKMGLLKYHVRDTYYPEMKYDYQQNAHFNISTLSNVSIINNETGISFQNNTGTATVHFVGNNKQLLISQLYLIHYEYKRKNDGLFFNDKPLFCFTCIQSSPLKKNAPDFIFIELTREDIEKILGLTTTQFWKRLKYGSLIGILCIAAYLQFR